MKLFVGINRNGAIYDEKGDVFGVAYGGTSQQATNRACTLVTAANLLFALIDGRGAIVSSADCSEMELAFARKEGRFYVDGDGFGFVLRMKDWRAKAEAALDAIVLDSAEEVG